MRKSEEFDWTDRDPCEETACLEILYITGEQVHQAQGQWLGPARVIGIEGGNVWVSHRATAIKCAKEQLRMASPAERELREMLMRIGGDDPDERSKHGVPRQQDLTQQQPPTQSPPQKQQLPQSSSQSQKQQLRKDPRQQQFHPEPGPQVKQGAPRQEPVHERQELRPKSRTTADTTTETTNSNAR